MKTTEKIENYFDIILSDEQKKILECEFDRPTLINACAGAGKTTMIELSVIYNALEKRVLPQDVLCVTFSRNARLDMERKYHAFADRLPDSITAEWGEPHFSTFHALFLKLIKKMPNTRDISVVPSYIKFLTLFDLPNESEEMTTAEQLEDIFNVRSTLVNTGYSSNGINITRNNDLVRSLKLVYHDDKILHALIKSLCGSDYSEKWFENYLSAMKTYNDAKIAHHSIDYDDMGLIVMNLLQKNKELFQNVLDRYKLVFLDEFQDINAVQWCNVVHLLEMNKIVAVGDDDQSIYTFRGSSPEFILNFANRIPGAQKFNLSTNYRTGGKILATVSDSIRNNVRRLDKTLSAYNTDVGSAEFYEDKNAMLEQFLACTGQDKSSAVLVRYNVDKTIVADCLAGHGIYVRLATKHQILQENRYFNIFYQFMRAFYYDNFDLFAEYSNRIGFSAYQKHVRSAERQFNPETITEYLNHMLEFDPKTGRVVCKGKTDPAVKSVMDTAEKVRKGVIKPIALFNEVVELTERYFLIMTKKYHRFSITTLDKITKYMRSEIVRYDDFISFENEQEERLGKLTDALEADRDDAQVAIETLHGAKGLEWDNVCLYGLDDTDINSAAVELSRRFPSNIKYEEFIKELKDNSFLTDDQMISPIESICRKFMLICQVKYGVDISNGNIPFVIINALENSEEPLASAAHLLYDAVIGIAVFVEDERRLMYVGVTRAKNRLFVDMAEHHSPLLNELKKSTV